MTANTPNYSTYLGGAEDDQGNGIATDSSGAAYVIGTTSSSAFPTASPRQGTIGGGTDAFVAKLTLPSATLGASTASIAESAGAIDLTVTLSVAPTYTTTVGYATSNGTATAGSDYSASSSTLTFAPGVSSQVISVPIIDDDSDEPNETFSVTLNSPSNAILGTPSSTTVTITDDDSAPTLSWQAGNFNAGEASGSGLVTVLLSAASSFTVTVNYATSDGSAMAGNDYTSKSGTLTFAPGVTSQSTSITILDDTDIESSETINLTLSSPSNATLGTASATMTIVDDDGGAQPNEEFYTYDQIGNMLSKTGVGTYSYPATGSAHPHAVTSVTSPSSTITYTYDLNGNMTGRGGLLTTWDADNRPLTINTTSGSESYAYDADGERVKVVAGSTTTVYLGGLWEETTSGATKAYYMFGGQTVAVRDSVNGLAFLHNDHLGSVSVASGAGASLLGTQRFDPWGKVLSGALSQTRKNYTGQYLDTTGLLYYHARYYDPTLARFVSADSLVSKHENSQAFNRYSYVTNNPLRYTDPTGHCQFDEKTGEITKWNCSVEDFDKMSIEERKRWTLQFMKQSGCENCFNNLSVR